MSEVTVYLASDLHPSEHVVLQPDYDSIVFDLAALREELAERNSVIDLKNRDALEAQTAVHGWARKYDDLQQRLADAERRNAELVSMLTKVRDSEVHEGRLLFDSITKLITLTKPEEAKS